MDSRPRPGTALRVLEADHGGGHWTLHAWVGGSGHEVLGASSSPTGAGVTDCPVRPETPWVQACVSASPRADTMVTGRVGADVAGFRARNADGSAVRATVSNGWFLLFLPPRKGVPTGVEVTDGSGAVLATLDSESRGMDLILGTGP